MPGGTELTYTNVDRATTTTGAAVQWVSHGIPSHEDPSTQFLC